MEAIALEAGEAAMVHYGNPQTRYKGDSTPLTEADLASHRVLVKGLGALTPELPILSEESGVPDWEERRHWRRYWLLDPIDGTKEFIAENGEFTVNIALIEHGRPLLGVVVAPALSRSYSGGPGLGAWLTQGGVKSAIAAVPQRAVPRVVCSRSHPSAELAAWLKALGEVERVPVGSSLKLCLLAQGEADLYPRLGPTSEWDIAAAHAVLLGAGGNLSLMEGGELLYNGKPSLLNPHFLARGTN
ncbi:3'(2'),5'-bisphosphate nucleotidase CysQ [Ferrimonas futtsuensis]|uniref:3'(2'),5'-bisphosphate nucleotidase CysQ n=1 Tax=Ferrimonas futtsuensis TaxID=364764 RepID=UPI00055037F7|nr:3'(2'),5'-bisphosphate nucleotidase CysQ [Ferrimonas futtsuensis]